VFYCLHFELYAFISALVDEICMHATTSARIVACCSLSSLQRIESSVDRAWMAAAAAACTWIISTRHASLHGHNARRSTL